MNRLVTAAALAASTGLPMHASAEPPAPAKDIGPRVVLQAGQAELFVDMYQTDHFDENQQQSMGNWRAIRPRALYGITDKWQVGIEAFIAAERAFTSIELTPGPGQLVGGTRPVKRLGAVLAEATYALQRNVGIRLRLGQAQYGGFARGPYAEPFFPNRDQPPADGRKGFELAFGFSAPARIRLASQALFLLEGGVAWNAESEWEGDTYEAYNVAFIDAALQLCGRPGFCVVLGTDLRRGSSNEDLSAFSVEAKARISTAFELGLYVARLYIGADRYASTVQDAIVGLKLRARFSVHDPRD